MPKIHRRIGPVLGTLFVMIASIGNAQQDPRFQIGGHGGVLDDGRGLAGGQIGVRVFPRLVGYVTGTWVTDVPSGADLAIYDAGIRVLLVRGPVQPYLLGGLSLEHSSSPALSGNITEDDLGYHFGAGLEVGRGWLRSFVEARGFKDGSVVGLFWGGIRIGFGK